MADHGRGCPAVTKNDPKGRYEFDFSTPEGRAAAAAGSYPLALATATRAAARYGAAAWADDLIAEAWLGIVRAARHFRPEFGVKWVTYAYTAAHRAAQELALRQAQRHGMTGRGRAAPPPARAPWSDEVAEGVAAPEDHAVRWSEEAWAYFLAELTPPDRAAVEGHVRQGLPLKDLAAREGRTHQALSERFRRGCRAVLKTRPSVACERG